MATSAYPGALLNRIATSRRGAGMASTGLTGGGGGSGGGAAALCVAHPASTHSRMAGKTRAARRNCSIGITGPRFIEGHRQRKLFQANSGHIAPPRYLLFQEIQNTPREAEIAVNQTALLSVYIGVRVYLYVLGRPP